MSKFDAINDSLDIEVVDEEDSSITKKESKAVEKDKKDSVRDYEYTRGNLYSLIEKGQEALDSIMEVAQEGQQPRAFEVVSQLIKNVADTTDKLVDLQQKMKNLEAEDAFKSAMQDKIGAALETKRREVANSFVKTVIKDDGDVEEV